MVDATAEPAAGEAVVQASLRTRLLLTRIDDYEAVAAVRKEFIGHVKPVDAIMQVDRFVDPDWLVEVEADAVIVHPTAWAE